MDKTPEELIELVGHDGTEKVFNVPPPYCFRSFHPQEFIAVSRFPIITWEYSPILAGSEENWIEVWDNKKKQDEFAKIVAFHDCVFISERGRHAAAWNATEEKVYDPNKGCVSLSWWLERYGVMMIYAKIET